MIAADDGRSIKVLKQRRRKGHGVEQEAGESGDRRKEERCRKENSRQERKRRGWEGLGRGSREMER